MQKIIKSILNNIEGINNVLGIIPEMDLRIKSMTIIGKPRKLKTTWTVEKVDFVAIDSFIDEKYDTMIKDIKKNLDYVSML